jgi:SAF domain
VPVKAPMLGKQPAPPVVQINGTDRPVGPPIPVQKLRQPGRSKRPLMLALMVLLMVVSALAAWFFVQKSAERVAVVGVAHDVAWGQEIQASDLVTVEMVPDPALKPVSWDQRSTLVGQLAATDLQTGMLLTARSVTDVQVPPPGKAPGGGVGEVRAGTGDAVVTSGPGAAGYGRSAGGPVGRQRSRRGGTGGAGGLHCRCG